MRLLKLVVGICLIIGFMNPSVWAYEEIKVDHGGTIRGKVSLAGGNPRPMAFNLVTIPDAVYCGRISTGTGWRIVEDFIISPDGALKDAVVMLTDIDKGKPFKTEKVRVEAIDCDFLPFMNVMQKKDELTVVNMDPIEHDIQGYETARKRGARVLFNRPLPMNPFHKVLGMMNNHTHMPGKPMIENVHLRKGRNIFVMQCGFHPYMFSWGLIVDNPYYAITKEAGEFEISNIPPGSYTLTVWHAGTKKYLNKKVTVEPKGSLVANFEYQAMDDKRRSVHEMHDNPRFGTELLDEGEEIVPSLRLQIP